MHTYCNATCSLLCDNLIPMCSTEVLFLVIHGLTPASAMSQCLSPDKCFLRADLKFRKTFMKKRPDPSQRNAFIFISRDTHRVTTRMDVPNTRSATCLHLTTTIHHS